MHDVSRTNVIIKMGEIMKRIFLISAIVAMCGVANVAYGACTATTKVYSSCNSGYYLASGDCATCPSPGSASDGGTSGISGCYIPSGTNGSDGSGSYTYSGNCYY